MLSESEMNIAIGMSWVRFNECEDQLEVWMEARPFTYRGHCPYARGLILEMIALCEQMMVFGDIEAEEQREGLLSLLDEVPPPTDPLNCGSVFM